MKDMTEIDKQVWEDERRSGLQTLLNARVFWDEEWHGGWCIRDGATGRYLTVEGWWASDIHSGCLWPSREDAVEFYRTQLGEKPWCLLMIKGVENEE